MAEPSNNGGNGKHTRGPNGQFLVGNPGGNGNPWATLSKNLKSAITRIGDEPSTREGIRTKSEELAVILWEMALGTGPDAFGVKGKYKPKADPYDRLKTAQRWAMEQLLVRGLGKPKDRVEIEDRRADNLDPFDILTDPEVTGAIDRTLARLSARPALGKPGRSSN